MRYHGNVSNLFRILISLGCKSRKRIVTPAGREDNFLLL